MTLSISARRLAFVFAGIASFLIFRHMVLQSARFWSGDRFLFGSSTPFSLGAEDNFSTYFYTFALFACGALLAAIAIGEARQGGYRPLYWYALSGIFLFLSMDEMMSIHERLGEPVKALVGESAVFHYAWVLPYGLLVIIVAIAFSRFLVQLRRRTAILFIVTGAVYVTGALGFDTLSGLHSSGFGNLNIRYAALEELLEISGTILFLYALADYAECWFEKSGFRLVADAALPRHGR